MAGVNTVKVKDHDDIARDANSGAIVFNSDQLEIYRKRRANILKERDKEREFQILKNDVRDLKSLISQLIESLNDSRK